MTSNKRTTPTTNYSIVPEPTKGQSDTTKDSPLLDVRSTVSNPLAQYPTTIVADVPSNTPTPDATNTPVEPTKVF